MTTKKRADEIKVGDLVYDSAYYASNKFVKVKEVRTHLDDSYSKHIIVVLDHCEKWFHPSEGVTTK